MAQKKRCFDLAMKHFAGDVNRKKYIGYEKKEHLVLVSPEVLGCITIMLGLFGDHHDANILAEIMISFGYTDFYFVAGINEVRRNEINPTNDYTRLINYMESVPETDDDYANSRYHIAVAYRRRINDAKEYTDDVKTWYELCKKYYTIAKEKYLDNEAKTRCDSQIWLVDMEYGKLKSVIAETKHESKEVVIDVGTEEPVVVYDTSGVDPYHLDHVKLPENLGVLSHGNPDLVKLP